MNKNTRANRVLALTNFHSHKREETVLEIDQTLPGKHSMGKRRQVVHIGGTISANTYRNLQQQVFINVDPSGKKSSITRHVPSEPGCVIRPKNHGYLEYRQPIGAR